VSDIADIEQDIEKTKKSKQVVQRLWQLSRFVKPYRLQMTGALVALILAAGSTLLIGQAIRLLLDKGFSAGSQNLET
jgi:ATP-binding cassette subfamily B protein